MPCDLSGLTAALADRYCLGAELGAGGMATVYRAHGLRHECEVALKVLRSDLGDALGRDRFLREIRLAASLTHPHILPLYDSGDDNGTLWFTMPLLTGETLRDRLAKPERLSIDDVVRLTGEVADALDYAHRHDVVHRDIKPENLLLHEGHAVVADFGIGKGLVAATEQNTMHTQIGVTVGTPTYMSPGQAAGEAVDRRRDLFALGCVLFEMLTGDVAFSGPTVQATIARRFVHTPPPTAVLRPDVPAALAQLVNRLLVKAAEARVASGAQVVQTLRTPVVIAAAPSPVAPPAYTERSVVVLPFVNVSPDADTEYFSDGLTDELITDLSHVKALRVISRTTAMQYKGSTQTLCAIGDTLGVRWALTGSVRRAGNARWWPGSMMRPNRRRGCRRTPPRGPIPRNCAASSSQPRESRLKRSISSTRSVRHRSTDTTRFTSPSRMSWPARPRRASCCSIAPLPWGSIRPTISSGCPRFSNRCALARISHAWWLGHVSARRSSRRPSHRFPSSSAPLSGVLPISIICPRLFFASLRVLGELRVNQPAIRSRRGSRQHDGSRETRVGRDGPRGTATTSVIG
ncbi:protein kinase domain-containing protein [Gemmatimonas sp.]|uniref:protein kinase domain-containing protein n=1 Tax=Gemmatimonas sp. TaxID=1962908 RepID=UPI003562EC08